MLPLVVHQNSYSNTKSRWVGVSSYFLEIGPLKKMEPRDRSAFSAVASPLFLCDIRFDAASG